MRIKFFTIAWLILVGRQSFALPQAVKGPTESPTAAVAPVVTAADAVVEVSHAPVVPAQSSAEKPIESADTMKPEAKIELELAIAQLRVEYQKIKDEQLLIRENLKRLEKGLVLKLEVPREDPKRSTLSPGEAPASTVIPAQLTTSLPSKGVAPAAVDFESALKQARIAFDEHKWNEAFVQFAHLEKDYPPTVHHTLPAYYLGNIWYQLKNWEQARQQIELFLSSHPEAPLDSEATLLLAKILAQTNQALESTKLIKELLQGQAPEEMKDRALTLLKEVEKKL